MLEKSASVLLVDDREDGLIALEAVLKDSGCRTVTASSGTEALKRIAEEDFAVVLLDIQMPTMDGFQTARRIREHDRGRYVPIIFITAINKDIYHVLQGYHAGAVDYLLKPFNPDILLSKVRVFADLYRMQMKILDQAAVLETQSRELRQLNESLKLAQKEIVEISEKERNRLGQDLHDGLAQELTAGCYMIRSIKSRWQESMPEHAASVFDELSELLQRSQTKSRRLARILYPVELEREGLAMALKDLAVNTSKVFEVDCQVVIEGPEFRDENELVKNQFYRIAQEAVQNAVRHAQAKSIRIIMANLDDKLHLEVGDDGIGIEEEKKNTGMGLRIIRHRSEMIGASLSIESTPKKGTRVRCQWLKHEQKKSQNPDHQPQSYAIKAVTA